MGTKTSAEIGRDRYLTTLNAGKHAFYGDEPESEGGTDLAPNPYELVLAGLGACTCATLRMYADRKGMALDRLHVDLVMEIDRSGAEQIAKISRTLKFEGSLSDEERSALLRIAEKCPVHKLLTGKVEIETGLV